MLLPRYLAMRKSFYLLTILLAACGSSKTITHVSYVKKRGEVPDYSDLFYWAAHPYKTNSSDSLPQPYRNDQKDTTVDVFFLHPTSYTDAAMVHDSLLANDDESSRWNASLNDSAINAKDDASSIMFQSSAFNHFRVFAPRYRQAHYQSFFIADSVSKPFFDTAYADIKNAFLYYLAHYNNGRPFIIASHSQGTTHAGLLIKELIENTPLMQQMVAAYIIGMPVPENYFTSCVPCSTATQTHCFVSWRTFLTGYTAPYVDKEKFKAVVVNPLTWTMDTTMASKALNKGAVLFRFNKPIQHAVSAQIHGNMLWVSKPHFLGSVLYRQKNYHVGDINLFWKNIRDNADERVQAFRKENR